MQLTRIISKLVVILAACALASCAIAQPMPSYGAALNLETAKKIAAAASVEAKKNSWPMAIAIVDNHGTLVYYEMADDTQTASAGIALDKARSAATFRRPTKVFEDAVAGGRVAILGLAGAVPIEGGLPVVVGGKIVGAIGVSGATAPQDGQVAKAGLEALK